MKSEDEDIPPPAVAVLLIPGTDGGHWSQYNASHAAIVTLVPTPPSHQEKLPTFSSVTAATGDTYSQHQEARGTG